MEWVSTGQSGHLSRYLFAYLRDVLILVVQELCT